MSEKVIKKQRNVAIELWRFIMAIAIIGFHAGFIIARSCNETTGYFMEVSNWFFGSSETLLVFTVTAGYFMAAHFTKRKNDPAYMSRSAASRAWEYTAARIKTLLPVLIIGYIIAIVVCTSFYYPDYKTQDVLVMIVNSIWEFLGFHAAGLRSTGNEFFNLNGPLWFISGMIIAGYFMYWALCKNEDVFSGFVTPLLAIFFAGWWCFTGTRASQTAWSTFGADHFHQRHGRQRHRRDRYHRFQQRHHLYRDRHAHRRDGLLHGPQPVRARILQGSQGRAHGAQRCRQRAASLVHSLAAHLLQARALDGRISVHRFDHALPAQPRLSPLR